ncbi:hypothetical protein [Sinimarinibacterium flocculans]|uniref:hypothetical protein n=1 Tax=Sinimarinibacterium flocculans TaxID=985250 RepID=UPI002492F776|nr:hypothetical protein [Sinimarinibacterium flocculans]
MAKKARNKVTSTVKPVANAFTPKPLKPLSPELQYQFEAASTPAQAGTPGVTAQPHLTGEQQMQDAQYWGSIAEQAAAARQRFLQQQTNTNYGIEDAKKQEAKASRSQNWAAAARGIFRSSIRDNALNDIAASTTTQVNRLQDAVDAIRNENLANYGYTFEGEQGAGDVQNAGMVKDAAGNWVPNVNTRIGKQLASYIAGQNQLKAENAKAKSSPGVPAVAASGPDRQWFISALTSSLSSADRQNLRDRAVRAGFATYKNGRGGAIIWR